MPMPMPFHRSCRARLSLPALLTAVMTALFPSACSSPPPEQAKRDVTIVDVVPVQTAGGQPRAFDGTIRPRRETALAFKQAGRVSSLPVQVGAHVRAGQVLGRLVPVEAAAADAQTQAEWAAAAAEARQARDAATRAEGLDAGGALSTAEVRQRQLAAQAAGARRDAARAMVRRSRAVLSEMVLMAPEDGVVTERLAEPGMIVDAGTPVLRLAGGAREIEIRVPESVRLEPGAMADVQFAGSPVNAQARMRLIAPAGDPTLRLRTARFVPVGGSPTVPLNGSATLTLRLPEAPVTTRVPLSAIGRSEDRPYVWLIAAPTHTIRRRFVRIDDMRGRDALVTGLLGGQSVVATAADGLTEGQTVVAAGVEPGFN